jgi:hypothetical protein
MFSKTESKYAFFYVTTQQKSAVSLKINEKKYAKCQREEKIEKKIAKEGLYYWG